MSRCRCTDIANAKNDKDKLNTIRSHIGEVWTGSYYTTADALGQLAKSILDGATPNNAHVFNTMKDKLEKPVYDKLNLFRDRCDNRIGLLPGQIRSLENEDEGYHKAVAAARSLFRNPK
jgi:uncharacterized small protein (DUF1192 family)